MFTDDAEQEMARHCYGYGHWSARHWFIGPEQGQAAEENGTLTARVAAHRRLGNEGLSDCESFHKDIGESRWHRNNPALQPTWRRLMLCLFAFKGEKLDDDQTLRTYQRKRLGSSNGETCLIELSGLPARNLGVVRDRESFRKQRIELIHKRMLDEKPELVVVYGKSQAKHWHALPTLYSKLAFSPHPVAHGSRDQDWIDLGQRLRAKLSTDN